MASASASECTATVAMPISLAGAEDAQRDLAAVGDEDLVEHGGAYSMTSERLAELHGLAVLDEDLDARGRRAAARIGFMVFIASMISRVWPSVDLVADLHERLGAGLGRQIDGADHRRLDRVAAAAAARWPRAAAGGRGRRRRRGVGHGSRRRDVYRPPAGAASRP